MFHSDFIIMFPVALYRHTGNRVFFAVTHTHTHTPWPDPPHLPVQCRWRRSGTSQFSVWPETAAPWQSLYSSGCALDLDNSNHLSTYTQLQTHSLDDRLFSVCMYLSAAWSSWGWGSRWRPVVGRPPGSSHPPLLRRPGRGGAWRHGKSSPACSRQAQSL